MKTLYYVFGCFAIALAMLGSCSDKATKPEIHTSTFPLQVGNHWRYQETVITIPYHIQSLADTALFSIACVVVGPDTLPNDTVAYIVDDTTYQPTNNNVEWVVARHWYKLENSKLMDYGFQTVIPVGSSDPIYRDPPIVRLDFPLNEGKIWNTYSSVKSSVEGHETLTRLGRNFECDIVNWDDTLHAGPGSWVVKFWYSDEGLIRYEHQHWPELISDSNQVIIDSARVILTEELTAINLIR